MNIKRSVRISIENRKKDGVPVVENVPIRLQVFFSGKRIDFTTGYRIDASKWDAAKQRVKNNVTNKQKQSASLINADIARYEIYINEIFQDFEIKEIEPTPEQVKEAFSEKLNPMSLKKQKQPVGKKEKRADFYTLFDEFVKDCGIQNNWTYATTQKFGTVKNHLINFNTKLSFDFFDEEGLNEYVCYLREKKDMRNSSVGKQVNFLRWFLRWAFKKGHHRNSAYDHFRPKLKNTQKKVIFLTWEELRKLREYQIPSSKQYLERMRDVFLFQCYPNL